VRDLSGGKLGALGVIPEFFTGDMPFICGRFFSMLQTHLYHT
jgi:hypothetical protein